MRETQHATSWLTRRAVLGGFAGTAVAGFIFRAASGTDMTVRDVREVGLVGRLFSPARPTGLPAVVSLAGAGGGLWEAPARALAREGFTALALATHNYEGRPERLRLLPVEYVVDAVEWLRRTARPEGGLVALRGWSRGGELALLAAALTPTINAVLAYAPRCYVAREQNKQNNFGDPSAVAAFTWKGQEAEGSALPKEQWLDPAKPSFEELHGIPVERIAGPIMFVAGTADTGIAGTTAEFGCAQAIRRLQLAGFRHRYVHCSYPGAGHSIADPPPFTGPLIGGGTMAADMAAVADSWLRSLAFLRAIQGA
jgi:dienelactone hydrolase